MAESRSKPGYSTARWRRLREKILLRDNYTCQISGALLRGGRSDKGTSILRPAVIDHIVPHRGDEHMFWDEAAGKLIHMPSQNCRDILAKIAAATSLCESLENENSEMAFLIEEIKAALA